MCKRVCPRSCNRTLQIQDRHYQDPLLLPLWLLWRNCHLLCQESEFYHLYCSRICQDLYRWCRKCLNIFDILIKWKKWTESVRESLDIMTFQFRYLQYFDISWSRQYDYKNLQGRLHQLKPVNDSKTPRATKKTISAIKHAFKWFTGFWHIEIKQKIALFATNKNHASPFSFKI